MRQTRQEQFKQETKNIPDKDDVMLHFSQWKPPYTRLHLKKKQSIDENLRVAIKL